VRVLRRVLSDLEIGMYHCPDAETAVRRLTRQRYEAVIVDCADEASASAVLSSARSAPCNKQAVAVAIIDGQKALRSAFDLGAHFVLYQPISTERAKSSFRAARALMKRERRRNTRVPVEIPVSMVWEKGGDEVASVTADVSEGGLSLKLFRRPRKTGRIHVRLTLPGIGHRLSNVVEVAWENTSQIGFRFMDLDTESHSVLKKWLAMQQPDIEPDDPPVKCKLTDLSLGGCYLQIRSPFPLRARVILSMQLPDLKLQVEGVVRVMHPEVGMGVEFSQKTPAQREKVEKFIHALVDSNGAVPELMVEPEGLDKEDGMLPVSSGADDEDPLLQLFRNKADLTAEDFHGELLKQRSPGEPHPNTISA
jgi:c-di-GMP-binding flagellar brake protein YcgR